MEVFRKRMSGWVAAMAAFTLSATSAYAQTVLSYSPWPASFVPEKVLHEFFADIERETEGRVRVELRAAMVGRSSAEQFDVVRDGITDLAMIVPGHTPGRFPLLEVAEMPFINSDHDATASSFYDVYETHLAPHQPIKGVRTLSIWLIPAQNVLTRNKTMVSTSDFKGMKLRSPNPASSLTMRTLGAVPVATGGDQMFEMASTGIIDGAFFNYQAMFTFNIHPYLRHFTVAPGGMTSGSNAILMNQDKWDSLSPKDREIISNLAGRALSVRISGVWAKEEREARANLEAEGVSFTDMSPELVAELHAALEPNEREWIEKAEGLGLTNAADVLEAMKRGSR